MLQAVFSRTLLMNDEPNPHRTAFEPAPLPDYQDRSTGLMVFGLLTLLLGCLAGLFVPLLLAGQIMAAKAADAPPANHAAIVPGLVVYGGLAVALICLGVGSMLARRWARALLLIFSWSWLVTGICLTATMPFLMGKVFANLPPNPKTGRPAMTPAAITGVVIGMTIFFFVFFVLVPALGFSLWTWLAVPLMLVMPLTGHGVMPFFGMFITGLPSALFCLVIAAVWGVAGWWLYRLDARGWWLILIAMVLFMVSSLLTYAHHDITELYQLQGLPQAQIDRIQKIGLFTGNRMAWMSVLITLPFLGYLLFIKKYLHKV
jgi:hypothetical protein